MQPSTDWPGLLKGAGPTCEGAAHRGRWGARPPTGRRETSRRACAGRRDADRREPIRAGGTASPAGGPDGQGCDYGRSALRRARMAVKYSLIERTRPRAR